MADVLNGTLDVASIRARFSSLQHEFAFLDAPGGSQVPDEVGEAIGRAMREASANVGAGYATSRRVQAILERAEERAARFLGCDPHEITLGPNMTSLNFMLSRTAGRDFEAGDEILVSTLDHDGGVAPWLELAKDRDLIVKVVGLHPDTTLDLDDLRAKLSDRTRVVAFAWASNAVGTLVDAAQVCQLAHEVGALTWIDAVHYAPHRPIDVRAIGADVLICSSYKFCGPHLGISYGRAEVLERWRPYKVRPAPMAPLGRRFDTGTPAFELLAGLDATFDYLDSIGGFEAIMPYERTLGERFLATIPDAVTVYGLSSMEGRAPTFLLNVDGVPAAEVARQLAERQIGVWAHDSWYAVNLYKRLGYEHDALRIGFIHYNTPQEVDRLLDGLADAAAGA
jgi:cysteine desulfurase family protein (TIGR01976 family)